MKKFVQEIPGKTGRRSEGKIAEGKESMIRKNEVIQIIIPKKY